eukprot:g9371.t1
MSCCRRVRCRTGESRKSLIKKYEQKFPEATPFIVACEKACLTDVKIFVGLHDMKHCGVTLKEMVNQEGKDSRGTSSSPLMIAAVKEHLNIVQYLLEHTDADPTIADSKEGWGLLHCCAAGNKNNTDVIDFLLEHEAVVNVVNKKSKSGYTALDFAYEWNKSPIKEEIVSSLRSHGGKANCHDFGGNNVGIGNGDLNPRGAIIYGTDLKVVREALITIDNINDLDEHQHTILDYVYYYNKSPIQQDIAALIQQRGGKANWYNVNNVTDEKGNLDLRWEIIIATNVETVDAALSKVNNINELNRRDFTTLLDEVYEFSYSPIKQKIIALIRQHGGKAKWYDENGHKRETLQQDITALIAQRDKQDDYIDRISSDSSSDNTDDDADHTNSDTEIHFRQDPYRNNDVISKEIRSLKAIQDLEEKYANMVEKQSGMKKCTPFIVACEKGNFPDVKSFVTNNPFYGSLLPQEKQSLENMVTQQGTDSDGDKVTAFEVANNKSIIDYLFDVLLDGAANDIKALNKVYRKAFPKGTPFICACEKGRVDHVKLFLQNPDLVITYPRAKFSFLPSTREEMLCNKWGKNVNGEDSRALEVANDEAIVNYIFDILLGDIEYLGDTYDDDQNNGSAGKLTKVYKKAIPNSTPFLSACTIGRFDDVKLFMSIATNKTSIVNQVGRSIRNNTLCSPLITALGNRHFDIAQYLVEEGRVDLANKGYLDIFREFPLHLAACSDNVNIVKIMLKRLSVNDCNNLNTAGHTAIDEAYMYTDSEAKDDIIQLIRKHGGKAMCHDKNGNYVSLGEGDLTDLKRAIVYENYESVQQILQNHEQTVPTVISDKHLLEYAIDTYNIDICKVLLNDERINGSTKLETTSKSVLHYICEKRNKLDDDRPPNLSHEQKHLLLTKICYESVSPTYYDMNGYNRDDIIRYAYEWPKVIQWARSLYSKFGRYKIGNGGKPLHRSLTSIVLFATDVLDNQKNVALKLMQNYDEFKREIITRFSDTIKTSAINMCVVKVLGWHLPDGDKRNPINMEAKMLRKKQRENVEKSNKFYPEYPYVLVMERGIGSLFQELSTQRIAGCKLKEIEYLFRQAVKNVGQLHQIGYIHCDLKPRNFVQVEGHGLLLCDLDAACQVGQTRDIDMKSSTGYCPPELAQCKFTNIATKYIENIQAGFDVWSLGVIFFELCTGQQLFHQDLSNDNLVNETDKSILCAWHTISDKYLSLVTFPNNRQFTDAARDLIRWCLKGKPDERPKNIDEILDHRFFQSSLFGNRLVNSLTLRPMKYHMFISHMQGESSGEIGTLYNALVRLGIHVWRDMSQKNIDANSMIQGVMDSDAFVVMLTNSYMSRRYCLLEFATALLFNKPIIVIVEENPMFWQWDLTRWKNNECSRKADHKITEERGWESSVQKLNGIDISVLQNTYEDLETKDMGFSNFQALKTRTKDMELSKFQALKTDKAKHIRDKIIEIYEKKDMIPHRRRGFEYEAMLYQLLKRANINVPTPTPPNFTSNHKFQVVYAEKSSKTNVVSGETIAKDIIKSLKDNMKQICTTNINNAEYVIVILTGGILEDDTCLDTLQEILTKRQDLLDKKNIIFVMSKIDGWVFDASKAEKEANNDTALKIRKILNGHEVMSYRPKGGNRNYEHQSMMIEMMKRLDVATLEEEEDSSNDGDDECKKE